jgi:hypothetical protein
MDPFRKLQTHAVAGMAGLGDHGDADAATDLKYLLHLLLPTWERRGEVPLLTLRAPGADQLR